MRPTQLRKPLSRTIVFDNMVGISLKSALWRTEPSPAVWQRIKRQLDSQPERDVPYRVAPPRQAVH
jgi:hypothetical protein